MGLRVRDFYHIVCNMVAYYGTYVVIMCMLIRHIQPDKSRYFGSIKVHRGHVYLVNMEEKLTHNFWFRLYRVDARDVEECIIQWTDVLAAVH